MCECQTQFAKCRWLVRAGIHVAQVIGTEFKSCGEQCRVGAIAVLPELGNEPNCLDSGFSVVSLIWFIAFRSGTYAAYPELVCALLSFYLGWSAE